LLAGKAEQAQAPLSGISVFYWLLLWGFVLKTTAILSFGATGAILAVWRQSEFWRQIVRRAPSQGALK